MGGKKNYAINVGPGTLSAHTPQQRVRLWPPLPGFAHSNLLIATPETAGTNFLCMLNKQADLQVH